jgi:hypothetical protein
MADKGVNHASIAGLKDVGHSQQRDSRGCLLHVEILGRDNQGGFQKHDLSLAGKGLGGPPMASVETI